MEKTLFEKYIVRPLGLAALFVWVFLGGISQSTQKEARLSKSIINISPAQADLTPSSSIGNINLTFAGSIGEIGGCSACSSGSCSSSSCSTCA